MRAEVLRDLFVRVGPISVRRDVFPYSDTSLQLLFQEVRLVEHEDERCFLQQLVRAYRGEQLQRIIYPVGPRIFFQVLVKCADWCQENDGRSYTGTGSAMVPSVKAQAAMRSPKQSTTRIGRRRERILCDNISTYRLRNRVPTLVADLWHHRHRTTASCM